MSEKKSGQAAAAQTEQVAPPPAKKVAVVVHTDNSKNGHLAARRLARAKAKQEQK